MAKAQSTQGVFPIQKKEIVEFQAQAPEVVGCREGPRHSTRTCQPDGGRQCYTTQCDTVEDGLMECASEGNPGR
jgi:hypothetical protein